MTGPIKSDELFSAWSRNQWKPVYLFAGQEDFLIEQALRQATSHWLKDDSSGLNLDRFDAENHSPGEIIQAAQTVPFLGSIRVIRVDNANEFAAADQKMLAENLKNLPPETRMIFIWGREWRRDDLKKHLVDWISLAGQAVIFWPLFPEQAQRWTIERASKHYKKTLSGQAAAWLVQQTTEGLRFLDQELGKVAAYVGGRPAIELEDLQESFGYTRLASPFEWLNSIRRKDSGKALNMLKRLLDEGEEPIRLLALLSRTIRDYLACVSLREPAANLAMRFHVKRGEEGRFAQELGRWTEEELIDAVRRCVEIDQALKTGQETPSVGMTLLTLEITKGRLLQSADLLR